MSIAAFCCIIVTLLVRCHFKSFFLVFVWDMFSCMRSLFVNSATNIKLVNKWLAITKFDDMCSENFSVCNTVRGTL